MANPYYDPLSSLADGKTASAADVQQEFNEVGGGFDAVYAAIGATIRFPDPVDPLDFTIAQRAAKLLGFDQLGDVALIDYLGTWAGDWAPVTEYPLYALVRAPESHFNSIYIVKNQHTSGVTFDEGLTHMDIFVDLSQTFRRTRTVLTTGTHAAVLGDCLFCDVTGGNITINLPTTGLGPDTPPIHITHCGGTVDASHKITVNPGGSQKIMTGTNGEAMEITDQWASLALEYLNSTYGWRLRML